MERLGPMDRSSRLVARWQGGKGEEVDACPIHEVHDDELEVKLFITIGVLLCILLVCVLVSCCAGCCYLRSKRRRSVLGDATPSSFASARGSADGERVAMRGINARERTLVAKRNQASSSSADQDDFSSERGGNSVLGDAIPKTPPSVSRDAVAAKPAAEMKNAMTQATSKMCNPKHIFFTNSGDCYHVTPNCYGLRKIVREPLNRRACMCCCAIENNSTASTSSGGT